MTSQLDWSEHKSFGALLAAVMTARNIRSDGELAQRATASQRHRERRLIVQTRSISNWRRGINPPHVRLRDQVELVRKALNIPHDPTDTLAAAWEARLAELWDKKAIDQAPVVQTTDVVVRNGNTYVEFLFRITNGLLARRLIENFLSKIRLLDWHKIALTVTALVLSCAAIVYVMRPSHVPPVSQIATRLPRMTLPYDLMNIGKDGFIFSDSDTRKLTSDEIRKLNGWELYLARNEIFARRGRIPRAACLDVHFKKFKRTADGSGWYEPTDDITYAALNPTEQFNSDKIEQEENLVRFIQYRCDTH